MKKLNENKRDKNGTPQWTNRNMHIDMQSSLPRVNSNITIDSIYKKSSSPDERKRVKVSGINQDLKLEIELESKGSESNQGHLRKLSNSMDDILRDYKIQDTFRPLNTQSSNKNDSEFYNFYREENILRPKVIDP